MNNRFKMALRIAVAGVCISGLCALLYFWFIESNPHVFKTENQEQQSNLSVLSANRNNSENAQEQKPSEQFEVVTTKQDLQGALKADEAHPIIAAKKAKWTGQVNLAQVRVIHTSSCSQDLIDSSNETIVEASKQRLEAEKEFPENAHIVRWEMAFGLPGPGVLLWAKWAGDQPATYNIYLQDASSDQHFGESLRNPAFKAPVELFKKGLSRTHVQSELTQLAINYSQNLGVANYRRMIVSSEIPTERAQFDTENMNDLFSGEFLNDRIIYFSKGILSCESSDLYELTCRCQKDP